MSSWLAKATGIHISPKRAYINKKELGRAALTAGGLALGGLGGGLVSKGVSKLGGLFGGKAADIAGDVTGDVIEGLEGGNIAGPSRFRRVADFLGGPDGFGMDDVVKYGKAGADAYGAYTDAKDRNRYQNIAMDEFNANAPLREAGRKLLMNGERDDLSGIFRAPEPRYRRVRVGSMG